MKIFHSNLLHYAHRLARYGFGIGQVESKNSDYKRKLLCAVCNFELENGVGGRSPNGVSRAMNTGYLLRCSKQLLVACADRTLGDKRQLQL